MAVTYYVALPFIRTDDGTAPGVFQQISLAARATLWRGPSAMSANAWTPTAYTPVTPGERRRLLSFARIQISYRE